MIVILHGWSDNAKSFHALAAAIRRIAPGTAATRLMLGDYVTMDDDVTFDDLAEAMMRGWIDAKLPRAPRSVDLVVHSTGALVARHWMTCWFTPATNPIRRLVMLAPANFGSPLAHKGASFLGRVVKGFKSRRLFHTGKRILSGLELASPFTWQLADRDRFAADAWFGPGRVLGTVLVGTRGYTGIAAMANTPGSDGTVYVSTANLNPAKLTLDFAGNPKAPGFHLVDCTGEVAFCRLPGDNHSTIAGKDGGSVNPLWLPLLQAALEVTDATFAAHLQTLADHNAEARRKEVGETYTQGFQNTVLKVIDDHGEEVRDYVLEAFARLKSGGEDKKLTEAIQTHVLIATHVHDEHCAFRALKFNCDRLQELLVMQRRDLHLSITASPEIRDTKSVGYSTVGFNDIGSIAIPASELGRVFEADRTLLVELKLKREQVADLFTFGDAPG